MEALIAELSHDHSVLVISHSSTALSVCHQVVHLENDTADPIAEHAAA